MSAGITPVGLLSLSGSSGFLLGRHALLIHSKARARLRRGLRSVPIANNHVPRGHPQRKWASRQARDKQLCVMA